MGIARLTSWPGKHLWSGLNTYQKREIATKLVSFRKIERKMQQKDCEVLGKINGSGGFRTTIK